VKKHIHIISNSIKNKEYIEYVYSILQEDDYIITDSFQSGKLRSFEYDLNSIKKADYILVFALYSEPDIFTKVGYSIGLKKNTFLFVKPFVLDKPELSNSSIDNFIVNELTYNNISETIDSFIQEMDIETEQFLNQLNNYDVSSKLNRLNSEEKLLRILSPRDFEEIVLNYFKEKGYEIEIPNAKYDFGYDFAIEKDGNKYIVEVRKTNESKVSVPEISALFNSIIDTKSSGGYIISSSGFTKAAMDYGLNSPYNVELLDINGLLSLYQ
jgi:HJR/Mrr/RecB family endonuclease